MKKEGLIKILENYEVFVDDDYGGSYQSIIAYTKDKKNIKSINVFRSIGNNWYIWKNAKRKTRTNRIFKRKYKKNRSVRKIHLTLD